MTKPLTIRPVDSATELGAVLDLVGGQLDPPSDRADTRFTELKREVLPAQRDFLLVAEVHGRRVGGALGFMNSDVQAVLRVLAVEERHRGHGIGRALLRAFEDAVGRRGGDRVTLGAGEHAGFYARHGYACLLMVQWVHDPAVYPAETKALLDGPLRGMAYRHASFRGVPQLFVKLDKPNPMLQADVRDLVAGAEVGHGMVRELVPTGPADVPTA